MLVVETIGRIRREHFVRGKSIKEIVRALKVSRNTVRKFLRSGSDLFRVHAGGAAAAEAGGRGTPILKGCCRPTEGKPASRTG